MRTHQEIDRRSLELARAVVAVIDADPDRQGLEKARRTCDRWMQSQPSPAVAEWRELLTRDWAVVRGVLLDETEEGQRRRQSNPFVGVLSSRERWKIVRHCGHEASAA